GLPVGVELGVEALPRPNSLLKTPALRSGIRSVRLVAAVSGSLLVHSGVVFLVGSAPGGFHPGAVLLIPKDGLLQALLKENFGFPAEFPPGFGGIQGIAEIVGQAVLHETDQALRLV